MFGAVAGLISVSLRCHDERRGSAPSISQLAFAGACWLAARAAAATSAATAPIAIRSRVMRVGDCNRSGTEPFSTDRKQKGTELRDGALSPFEPNLWKRALSPTYFAGGVAGG